jgi:hypothetical protein
MIKRAIFAAGLVALGSSLATASVVVNNNSFELPAFGNGGWSYLGGANDSWTYGGQSGVSNENAPWFTGAPPDGTQAAFCQNNGCSITQSVTGFVVGQFYSVDFYAAERTGTAGTYPSQPLEVLLGGSSLGIYTPPDFSFTHYTTTTMQATSTTMTLQFLGVNATGGDSDTALDLVTINSVSGVPEPGTMALAGIAIVALMIRRRRSNP